MKSNNRTVLLSSLSAVLVMQSNATARSWTGATNTDWGTTTNWSPNGTPGIGDSVFFDANSTGNLSNTLGATSYSVQYISATSGLTGDVSIASTGGVLTLNTYGIAWYDGVTKNLSISADIATGAATQAWWADPGTTVSLSGNATLNCSLLFRGSKTGSSAVTTGTYKTTGNVTVASGKGVQIGDSGYDGKLEVAGGVFDATLGSDWIIGQASGDSNGTLLVSGTGELKGPNASTMYVGNFGTGTLTVSGTGIMNVATSGNLIVIGREGGTGTLNLDGGTLLTSRSIRGSNVNAGNGTVNFNGGTLKAKDGDNANWLLSASTFNAYVKGSATPETGAVIDTNGYNMGIPVALQHDAGGPATDGGLTKKGTGTLTLTAANTYTGTTKVEQGTLALGSGGSIANTSTIIVGASCTLDVAAVSGGWIFGASQAQTLSGTGAVTGSVTVGALGVLAPGNSPGDLTFNDNLGLGGTLNLEITGIGAGMFDRLVGDGANTLTLGGILNLDNTGYTPTLGNSVVVFSNWSSLTDNFTSITGTNLGGGLSWDTSTLATNGTLTVIPEPSAAILLGLGTLGLALRRRRS